MSFGSGSQAAEQALAGKAVVKTVVHCPECGSDRPRRMERKGFVEQRIFSFLGYFPWRCGNCKSRFFLRKRSRGRHSKREEYVA